MKQEFQIGEEVSFETLNYNWSLHPESIKCKGKVIEYNERGFFNKRSKMGFKRYKVQLDDGSIIFLGASRMKKVK